MGDSKKRKKSKEELPLAQQLFIERQELRLSHEFVTVTMKLNTLFRKENDNQNQMIKQSIQEFTMRVNKVLQEGYHLANFHLLRCLESNLLLPTLNLTFFTHCLKSLITNAKDLSKDLSFLESTRLFKDLRPDNYEEISHELIAPFLVEMALQMETMTHNHIIENFIKRLQVYMWFTKEMYKSQVNQYVYKIMTVYEKLKKIQEPKEPSKKKRKTNNDADKDEKKKEKENAKITNQWQALTVEDRHFAEWLQFYPSKQKVKQNMNHFIKINHKILCTLNYLQQDEPNQKKLRSFTMLPVKTSFTLNHIFINAPALSSILSFTYKKYKQNFALFKKDELGIRTVEKKPYDYWNKIFKIQELESDDVKSPDKDRIKFFQGSITTNGYSVSILFYKKRKDTLIDENDVMKTNDELIINNESQFKNENPQINLNNLNIDQYDSLIGIDPGLNHFATIYRDNNNSSKKYKTTDYFYKSFRDAHKKWFLRFKERNLTYAKIIGDMKSYSFKTGILSIYIKSIQYVLKHRNYLFQASMGFLKWKFKLKHFKEKALHYYAKDIIKDSKNPCIGFGNWNQAYCRIKKRPKFPMVDFKKLLEKRNAEIIILDEYNTTITCSTCHEKCVKLKAEKVPPDILNELHYYQKPHGPITHTKQKKKLFWSQFKKAQSEKNQVMSKSKIIKKANLSDYEEYLCCSSNICKTKYSHRDKNAAINLLMLLKVLLTTKDPANRPQAFKRSKQTN